MSVLKQRHMTRIFEMSYTCHGCGQDGFQEKDEKTTQIEAVIAQRDGRNGTYHVEMY